MPFDEQSNLPNDYSRIGLFPRIPITSTLSEQDTRERPSWKAYRDLLAIQRDRSRRYAIASLKFKDLEYQMAQAGIKMTSPVFQRPVLDHSRIDERDRLIAEYNQANPDKSQIMNSQQALDEMNYNLYADIFHAYDFSNETKWEWTKKIATTIAYSTYRDVIEHPIISVGAAVSGGLLTGSIANLLPTTVPAAMRYFLGNVATGGLIASVANIPERAAERREAETFRKEQSTFLADFSQDFVYGSLITGALNTVGAVARIGINKYLKTTSNPAELTTVLEDPLARAVFVDSLKMYSPTSTLSPQGKHQLIKDNQEVGRAILNNDGSKVRTIFQKLGEHPIIGPKLYSFFESIKTFSKSGKETLRSSIETQARLGQEYNNAQRALSNIKLEDINNAGLRDFVRGNLYGADEIPSGTFSQLAERKAKLVYNKLNQITTELSNTDKTNPKRASLELEATNLKKEGNAIARDVANALTLNYKTVLQYEAQTEGKQSRAINKIRKSIRTLHRGKGISEIPLGEEITEEIFGSLDKKQRTEILKIYSELNRLKILEPLLRIAKEFEPDGSFTNRSVNTLRNYADTQLEEALAQHREKVASMVDEISDFIKNAKKQGTATGNDLDMVKFVDAMLKPKQSTTGSLEANIARIFKKYIYEFHNGLINKGVDTVWVPDAMPNMWSPNKIAKVSKEEFIADLLRWADEKKTIESLRKTKSTDVSRQTPSMKEYLSNMYENASADLSPRLIRNGNNDLIQTGDRTLHLKDGFSWVQAHEKYGRDASFTSVLDYVTSGYRKLAARSVFGLNSVDSIKNFNSTFFNYVKKIISEKAPKFVGEIDRIIPAFEKVMIEVGGFGLEPTAVGRAVTAITQPIYKAMTSTAFITAAFVDSISSASLLKRAIGIENSSLKELAAQLGSAVKGELEEVIGISRYINSKTIASLTDSLPTKIYKKVIGLPSALLDGIAKINERMSRLLYTRHLAKNKELPFNKLPLKLKKFFRENGITGADWNAYRKLPTHTVGGKVEVLSAHYLRNKRLLNNSRLFKLFAVAERKAIILGAPNTTSFGRYTGLAGATKGLDGYNALRVTFLDPFVGIVQSIFYHQFNAVKELAVARQYSDTAFYLMSMLFAGYATYGAKSLLNGRKVDLTTPKALHNALLYSGIFGPAVDDFVFSLVGMTHRTPTEQLYQSLLSPNYKNLRTIAKLYNPYGSSIVGEVFQKYTIDQVFRLIDPEGAEEYDRQLIKQLYNDDIYAWRAKILGETR